MYESEDKMVSHPPHYISESGLESIQVIEAFTARLTGIEATDTGNIIKYILRWKEKNGVQDLKKIMWYTQHLIDHLEKIENSKLEVCEESSILDKSITSAVIKNPISTIQDKYGMANKISYYNEEKRSK